MMMMVTTQLTPTKHRLFQHSMQSVHPFSKLCHTAQTTTYPQTWPSKLRFCSNVISIFHQVACTLAPSFPHNSLDMHLAELQHLPHACLTTATSSADLQTTSFSLWQPAKTPYLLPSRHTLSDQIPVHPQMRMQTNSLPLASMYTFALCKTLCRNNVNANNSKYRQIDIIPSGVYCLFEWRRTSRWDMRCSKGFLWSDPLWQWNRNQQQHQLHLRSPTSEFAPYCRKASRSNSNNGDKLRRFKRTGLNSFRGWTSHGLVSSIQFGAWSHSDVQKVPPTI